MRLLRRVFPRWYDPIPEAVLAAGLTYFFFDQIDAATSAFKSPRAIVIMAGAAIVWIATRLLMARYLPVSIIRIGVMLVAAAVALSIVVLPAYDDDTVVETLAAAVPTTPASTIASPIAPSTVTAPGAPTPTTVVPTTVATTVPPQPVRVRTSEFRGIDHRAAGTVAIYKTPEGRFVVGLEDFDIQPGPDYDVYVVPGANRRDRSGGGVKLDDLRGNKGTQYYDVPASFDLAGPVTVLIWCNTFGVPVANSTPV